MDVDQAGVVLAPDCNIWPAVAVPARTANVEAFEYTMPPLLAVREAAVPPRVKPNCPVHPAVIEAAFTNAVVELPPRVKVTFVSSAFVRAAPVGICDVVAKVPEVGKVTVVVLDMVKVLANAPLVVKLPPRVSVLEPLLMPVPPREEESCPVHPAVMEVAFNNEVSGLPPSVSVTLVSFTRLNAVPFDWNNVSTCCKVSL